VLEQGILELSFQEERETIEDWEKRLSGLKENICFSFYEISN
jgi:hypothetical protein